MAIWQDAQGNLHDDMDGTALSLANWPLEMTQLTDAQLATILPAQQSVEAAAAPALSALAQDELDMVTGPRGTVIRCLAAGVAVPVEWIAYIRRLRAIANGADTESTSLPERPAYPEGT
jgi:hypothetical protein